MRALAHPQREAQNAGTGTPTARSPECGPTTAVALQRKAQNTNLRSSFTTCSAHFVTAQLHKVSESESQHRAARGSTENSCKIAKKMLDTNFAVCSYGVFLVPAAPNTFQIARKRIAALFLPLAMLHKTKCRQLNGLQRTACSALIFFPCTAEVRLLTKSKEQELLRRGHRTPRERALYQRGTTLPEKT